MRLLRNKRGAVALEYIILASAIALIMIHGFRTYGGMTESKYNRLHGCVLATTAGNTAGQTANCH